MDMISQIQNTYKPSPIIKKRVSVALFLSDALAMIVSFVAAVAIAPLLKDLFFAASYTRPLFTDNHFQELFFVWMCPVVLILFVIKGHYTQRIPWWSQVQHVLTICVVAFVIDGFMRFALDMPFSRFLVALSWVVAFFLIILGRQIVYIIARALKIWSIPTVIIGDRDTVVDILYAFSTDHYTGYDIKRIILHDDAPETLTVDMMPKKYAQLEIEAYDSSFVEQIPAHTDHFFVVSVETLRGKDRDHVLRTLSRTNAMHAVVPPISRTSLSSMESHQFFGYDVMLLSPRPKLFTFAGRMMKRGMDIIISGVALLFLLPIIIVVGVMLKVEGQSGSIFYGGKRVGRNGALFKCWKFQSMEPNSDHLLQALLDSDPEIKADWDIYRKLKVPDPRITTKTAAIIRKTSIDELPQLWNVFIGDMSLVGPRPILQDEVDLFGEDIRHYIRTNPGITGLWQVSGRNDTSFERRVYWDKWYVRNWSFWGDLVILIKTIRVVLGKSGAY